MNEPPGTDNSFLTDHVTRLNDSYRRLTGKTLVEGTHAGGTLAMAIFNAPFAVLSSGTEPDPLFNYANLTALRLFELDWASLIEMPARKSASPCTKLVARR